MVSIEFEINGIKQRLNNINLAELEGFAMLKLKYKVIDREYTEDEHILLKMVYENACKLTEEEFEEQRLSTRM